MSFTLKSVRLPVILTLAIALSGCNALTRLSSVGAEPPLTTIQNPTLQANYRPVSMPMCPTARAVPRPTPRSRSWREVSLINRTKSVWLWKASSVWWCRATPARTSQSLWSASRTPAIVAKSGSMAPRTNPGPAV